MSLLRGAASAAVRACRLSASATATSRRQVGTSSTTAAAAAAAAGGAPATPLAAAATGSLRPAVAAAALNLHAGVDVEDFVITGAGASPAAAAAAGGVRPLAVVKVGGEVITKDLPALVASLTVLRDAGLQPVVVHGGGPQLNDELAKAGVEPEYIGGKSPSTCFRHNCRHPPLPHPPPPTHPPHMLQGTA